MGEINLDKVAKKYNAIKNIWHKKDKWHQYTKNCITAFIYNLFSPENFINKSILNAGSGGESYGFPEDSIVHLDIAEEKIKNKKNYIVANIENTSLESNQFDLIISVGSVINYCDAFKVIKEFSSLLKSNGELILEFESSRTLELIFNEKFNASSILIKTIYQNEEEVIWYYSENYILSLLIEYGFVINKIKRFHILSPFVFRMTNSLNIAYYFSYLDVILQHIPYLNRCASNVILYAKKAR